MNKVKLLKPKGENYTSFSRLMLDHKRMPDKVSEFDDMIKANVIGQPRALKVLSLAYSKSYSQLRPPNRPIGIFLFLGPTGSGKTHSIREFARALYGNPNAFTRVNCADYQQGHEIAKLIGSPPGYIGGEITPRLSQKTIDAHHTAEQKISIILFDEIEKGHPDLFQLLLGIFDDASLVLSRNDIASFRNTVIFMTSNLGAKEIQSQIVGKIGFAGSKINNGESQLDQNIYETAKQAAQRYFVPEFMNRITKVVVFRTLKEHHYMQILEKEIASLKQLCLSIENKFAFSVTDEVKQKILHEGYKAEYGGRELNRAIDRYLTNPLDNLLSTKQIVRNEFLEVGYNQDIDEFSFTVKPNCRLVDDDSVQTKNFTAGEDLRKDEWVGYYKSEPSVLYNMKVGLQCVAVMTLPVKKGHKVTVHISTAFS